MHEISAGASALGRPRGIGWRGRREGGSGWGTHVNPWLIHVNVWQNPPQYCKVISLQLIKINGKKIHYEMHLLQKIIMDKITLELELTITVTVVCLLGIPFQRLHS